VLPPFASKAAATWRERRERHRASGRGWPREPPLSWMQFGRRRGGVGAEVSSEPKRRAERRRFVRVAMPGNSEPKACFRVSRCSASKSANGAGGERKAVLKPAIGVKRRNRRGRTIQRGTGDGLYPAAQVLRTLPLLLRPDGALTRNVAVRGAALQLDADAGLATKDAGGGGCGLVHRSRVRRPLLGESTANDTARAAVDGRESHR
jgi:hypothetical protein